MKTYVINKGINKPIEFKGLKAQYIWHLAGAVLGVLAVFTVLYVAGVSSLICVPVAFGLGGFMVAKVYRMSRKYGQFGLMKREARKKLPAGLLSGSRKFFIELIGDHAGTVR